MLITEQGHVAYTPPAGGGHQLPASLRPGDAVCDCHGGGGTVVSVGPGRWTFRVQWGSGPPTTHSWWALACIVGGGPSPLTADEALALAAQVAAERGYWEV